MAHSSHLALPPLQPSTQGEERVREKKGTCTFWLGYSWWGEGCWSQRRRRRGHERGVLSILFLRAGAQGAHTISHGLWCKKSERSDLEGLFQHGGSLSSLAWGEGGGKLICTVMDGLDQLSDCWQLKMHLKEIFFLYDNFTTQRCPKEKMQIYLIEDFFHLPPVSTTPVVHLKLRISPRIFEKNWNGRNGILRGLGETDSWKKPDVEDLVTLSL